MRMSHEEERVNDARIQNRADGATPHWLDPLVSPCLPGCMRAFRRQMMANGIAINRTGARISASKFVHWTGGGGMKSVQRSPSNAKKAIGSGRPPQRKVAEV